MKLGQGTSNMQYVKFHIMTMTTSIMAQTVFLIISLVYCILHGSLSEDNRCEDRCCLNFREEEGRCIECIGSFGVNCSEPCPPDHYGKSCRHQCICDLHELCVPVHGCCNNGITCQQRDAYANSQNILTEKEAKPEQGYTAERETDDNQSYTTEKETKDDEESPSETLVGIFLSVSATILLIGCLISVYTWIRQNGLMRDTEPKTANVHEEYTVAERNENESCYDEIGELQMIMDDQISTV